MGRGRARLEEFFAEEEYAPVQMQHSRFLEGSAAAALGEYKKAD